MRCLTTACLPAFTFFDEHAHREREEHRRETAQEYVTPGILRIVGQPDARDLVVDDTRQHDAERGGGLQQRAGFDAMFLGYGLGHERSADGPLAADAEAGQRAKQRELLDAGREGAQCGAERVREDGEHQRKASSMPVGEPAEQHASRRPADQQHGREDPGPVDRG